MNGSAPQALDVLDDRLGDQVDVGDAAAAGGDRHALARLDALVQPQFFELRPHFAGDVGDARRFERLPQAKDRGKC